MGKEDPTTHPEVKVVLTAFGRIMAEEKEEKQERLPLPVSAWRNWLVKGRRMVDFGLVEDYSGSGFRFEAHLKTRGSVCLEVERLEVGLKRQWRTVAVG